MNGIWDGMRVKTFTWDGWWWYLNTMMMMNERLCLSWIRKRNSQCVACQTGAKMLVIMYL